MDEITRAQREAAGYVTPFEEGKACPNTKKHSLDDSGMNLTIRDQPIFEDESQAKKAMDDMANTLRMVSFQIYVLGTAGLTKYCDIARSPARN